MATVEQPRKEDTYGLQRNLMSSIRLNAQHYVWREATGFNIHSDILVYNVANTRIADVGTGTGIWAFDVKRQYPEVQVDGFDVSIEQAPAPEWAPPGTSLSRLDITEPIPEYLRERYDVIHVRLFIVVVKNNNPVPIIKNLIEMLKPGGWLQWGDLVMPWRKIVSVDPQRDRTGLDLMLEYIIKMDIGRWMADMPEILSSQGMGQAKLYKYPTLPHTWLYWTQLSLHAALEMSHVVKDNNSDDGSGPQMRKLIDKATQETRNGVAMSWDVVEAVARKPDRLW